MRRRLPNALLHDSVFDRESTEFDRSLGFVDAAYAIALTLLILNLDVPNEDDWRSVDKLLGAVGGQLVGFLISFVVIVVFWLSNHGIISRLRRLDRVTIVLNLAVLGFVIFIPFTTQAMSDPGLEDLPLPTVVYAVNVAAAIVTQTVMYEVAMSRGYGRVERSARTRQWERIDSLTKPAVFLLSVPIAFAFGGIAGKLTWLLMVPLSIITGRITRRAEIADATAAQAAPSRRPHRTHD